MQFTFQILLLAAGFAGGYWLIISANSQQGTIKTLGQALGGVLIVMAIILEVFSAYYSIKISNRGYMQGGCPMNRDNQIQPYNDRSIKERSGAEQDTNTQMINPQGNEQEASPENKNVPIKSNIKDHE